MLGWLPRHGHRADGADVLRYVLDSLRLFAKKASLLMLTHCRLLCRCMYCPTGILLSSGIHQLFGSPVSSGSIRWWWQSHVHSVSVGNIGHRVSTVRCSGYHDSVLEHVCVVTGVSVSGGVN